jgi:hypothetical protein
MSTYIPDEYLEYFQPEGNSPSTETTNKLGAFEGAVVIAEPWTGWLVQQSRAA